MVSSYPVQFNVDFPSKPLSRLSTAFRFIVAIPIVVLLTMLSGEAFRDSDNSAGNSLVIGGAAVFVVHWAKPQTSGVVCGSGVMLPPVFVPAGS